jgi:hypothetical protein
MHRRMDMDTRKYGYAKVVWIRLGGLQLHVQEQIAALYGYGYGYPYCMDIRMDTDTTRAVTVTVHRTWTVLTVLSYAYSITIVQGPTD